jgi:peptidoglycan/xylan/chitin deacetylase (PgdA/CDA1 family)
LGEVAARLLRPPHWILWVVGSIPLFRLSDVYFFVKTEEPLVALTLDDGPDRVVTPSVLDVLAKHNARATFFLLGERAACNEELLQRIVAEGHELGNHTWYDERSASLSRERLDESLSDTGQVLEKFGEVALFRPGGGSLGWGGVVTTAKAHGYTCVLGSVYPHDVRVRSTSFIVRDVVKRARSGSIIILHEGKRDRARVAVILDEVLGRLGDRGFRVTTASDLLRLDR